ncbi:MAG: protein phosphatase 2C domain-containing protein [Phycisphaerae bacterium]|nr:protein phosphatase 2C domain-containing protein [Phycisphaerae bacterium]
METPFHMILPLRWGVASDVGQVRTHNEDAYAIEPEAGLFLVSDGMGGHQGGELASEIVTQDLPPAIEIAMTDLTLKTPRAIRRILNKWIAEQSRQVRLEGHSESGFKDMGATLVLALFVKGRAYIANLGDSRAYRFRGGRLKQFSRDHSVVAELVEQGHITPEEAQTHEDLGAITHYAGMDEHALPHVRSFALKPGDRILLCSDGLTDMLSETAIAATLAQEPDNQMACHSLVEQANQAGGHDNITVIIVESL